MKPTAYGVGVGSGDPELMTLKAVRLIKENNIIAVVGNSPKESTAYKIAVQSVPELAEKTLLPINMPMTRDEAVLTVEHIKGARLIEEYLDKGENVVYLTLGDPTVYCSFGYLQRILEADGYRVELVSGVTSFCAAAASLGVPLAEKDEQLHVITESPFEYDNASGTYVFMKSGKRLSEIKSSFQNSDYCLYAAEKCGMPDEKIYRSADEFPDTSGYFTVVIAKRNKSS